MQHVVHEDGVRAGEPRVGDRERARELPSGTHHEQDVQRPDRKTEGTQENPGPSRRRAGGLTVPQRHADQSRVHESQTEQQGPVNRAPMTRARDDTQLRRSVTHEQRMHETGDAR